MKFQDLSENFILKASNKMLVFFNINSMQKWFTFIKLNFREYFSSQKEEQ